jgi:hypothetical protein
MEGLCKRNDEFCVKDRRSKTGHYVIPMGKVSEIPPPSPLIGRGEKVQACPGLKRTFEAGKNTGSRGEKVQD